MTVAACGSKYLRTPSDETSFLTWQISRQTVDYAEAWIGKQVITGTFREFLGKESLTLRTDRKEESNVFESIHKVSDFENSTAAGHDGKIKAMASAVHKKLCLGQFWGNSCLNPVHMSTYCRGAIIPFTAPLTRIQTSLFYIVYYKDH